jgi:signal transduction histidine kinase/CheY-like chemotaxis protein
VCRGPSKTAIYNEQWIQLAGTTHPTLMGSTLEQKFPKVLEKIGWALEQAERTKVAVDLVEIPLTSERSGYKEETYFTGSFIPLRGDDSKVYGFYNTAYEVTRQKLNDRRVTMLNRLEIPSGVHEGTLASYVIPQLETNPLDIPMAMLFQIDESNVSESVIRLRGQIGVPENHPLVIDQADLSSCIGLYPVFCKAKKEIVTLPVDERFAGIEWRGHRDGLTGFCQPSSYFSVLPIATADRLYGFLVLGANARRPIDDDHHSFMLNIAAKISTIAASVASAEETRRRAERLERELVEREKQIRYMAQYAPVGMQHLSSDGSIIWANEMYYQHTGHPKDAESQYNFSFLDVFIEEDRGRAMECWADLLQGASHVEISLRIKRMYFPPNGEPEHACLLFLAFPYMVDGEIKSLMGCTTDISQLKWAEAAEARNAADAREAKRQQEEFIDVVSHEMRNPLSAIFQCADMISNSYRDLVHMSAIEILKSNIEAANTITMCANHQKHIVDDVLTLSKLKYMMLTISPRPVRPISIFDQVVKMFQADLASHDITVNTIVQPSIGDNKIDWVMFDSSRVTQILINLLTNAIKFTKGESQRKITITYGAALTEPRDTFPKDLYWVPCEKKIEDLTLRPEWGNGEHVFLTCSVTDTGAGMRAEEIPRLFARFEQANSKTSIKYGGSGLGLFISQQLTEKQGGRIGLSSVLGQGSTFGFYVKARRNTAKLADSTALSRRSMGRAEGNGATSTTMHVLLVEDNLVNQKILNKQLTRAGCIVHVANHGLEALEILRQSSCWHEPIKEPKRLDIILMDWEMPVMDGLTCSREIRKLQQAGKIVKHIEIIATTANAREEQIELALHNGIVSLEALGGTAEEQC